MAGPVDCRISPTKSMCSRRASRSNGSSATHQRRAGAPTQARGGRCIHGFLQLTAFMNMNSSAT